MTPILTRWRLLLGAAAERACGGLEGDALASERALEWLYGREDPGNAAREQMPRQGGDGASVLSVPDWINEVHRLFPKETIERLERDAVERFGIHEIVTNPAVLERLQPNPALLEAVLRTRHLMNPAVLALARQLVARVVRELMDKLARQMQQASAGSLNRRRRTRIANSRNFDAAATLRANLKHFDPASRQLGVDRALFATRSRRQLDLWQLLIVVDQSGSMLSSVIHASVTAACLHGLPGIKSHLIAFDTAVVDFTDQVDDPAECLMRVQLGGGTDIAGALAYAAQRIEAPRRAIIVLITDFCEGGPPQRLIALTRDLVAQGTRVLGLAALDDQAEPAYDRELAQRLVEVGAEVGAMTPGQLARWLAEKLV
jgi:Mg-chelatase subunit ChlD